MTTMKELNEYILKEWGDDTEITFFENEYHVLHICSNNHPIPLFIHED